MPPRRSATPSRKTRRAPAATSHSASLRRTGMICDGAAAQFRKALEIDPGNAEAEGGLGHALVSSGSIDEAIPHLRRALELAPANGEADIELGIALAKKGQLDEAMSLFQKALVLMPDSADAHYYLGKALVLTGRVEEGLVQWKQALQSQPDSLQVLNDMAWVLATSRDDTSAQRATGAPIGSARRPAHCRAGTGDPRDAVRGLRRDGPV